MVLDIGQVEERVEKPLDGAAAVFDFQLVCNIIHLQLKYQGKRISHKRGV